MRTFSVIVIMILLYSCSTTEWQPFSNKDYNTFTEEAVPELQSVVLEPDAHTLFTDSLIFPGRLLTVGHYLIVAENKGSHPFHIYNLETEEYIQAGTFGQGPSEVLIAWNMSPIDEESFLVLDGMQKKVVAYNVQDLINGKGALWENKIDPQGLAGCPIYKDNSIFYLKEVSGEQRLYELNLDTQEEIGYGALPEKENTSVAEHVHSQAFQALMARRGDDFVISYRLASFFEVFDAKTNSWEATQGPDQFNPIYKQTSHEGSPMFAMIDGTRSAYLDICAGEEYTYLLYDGDELDVNSFGAQGNTLFMLDSNGKVVKKQEIATDLGAMTVYNDSVIYGIRYDVEPELVKYALHPTTPKDAI
ncbi:MAG: BF3164 family lipoprotein [Bacteroidota bacterium]